MSAYLQTRKTAIPQYRPGRRGHPTGGKITGAIVVHTSESILDSVGVDTGAEAVADWMTRRKDYGSYHRLVDSDSIVPLVDFANEAFHDGTGGNRWSLGLSFACRTSDWTRMTSAQRAGFMRQGAKAAAEMIRWAKAAHGVTIPLARITKGQYKAGRAGFISHGEVDPGRRSDPGTNFPWNDFFSEVSRELGGSSKPSSPAPKATPKTVQQVKGTWRKGDQGPEVQLLQGLHNILLEAGLVKGKALITEGKFGENTKKGIQAIQKFGRDMETLSGQKVSIAVDGVAGPQVFRILAYWVPVAQKKKR